MGTVAPFPTAQPPFRARRADHGSASPPREIQSPSSDRVAFRLIPTLTDFIVQPISDSSHSETNMTLMNPEHDIPSKGLGDGLRPLNESLLYSDQPALTDADKRPSSNGVDLIEQSFYLLVRKLRKSDYEVNNERELCHWIFHSMIETARIVGIPAQLLRAEVREPGLTVDLAVRSEGSRPRFSAMIEAKTWLGPADASMWSKRNQPTAKRNSSAADGARLAKLITQGVTSSGGLVILERGSTHLRRLLEDDLAKHVRIESVRWADIRRVSLPKRREHVGLIWVRPAAQS